MLGNPGNSSDAILSIVLNREYWFISISWSSGPLASHLFHSFVSLVSVRSLPGFTTGDRFSNSNFDINPCGTLAFRRAFETAFICMFEKHLLKSNSYTQSAFSTVFNILSQAVLHPSPVRNPHCSFNFPSGELKYLLLSRYIDIMFPSWWLCILQLNSGTPSGRTFFPLGI